MSIYKPKSGVAFDIDGIVLDTGTEIWKVITNHLGLPWPIDEWKEYYIENVVGQPLESLRPVYEEVLHREDLPLLPAAMWVLEKFHEITQEPILFITARRPQFVDTAAASIRRAVNAPIEVVGTSKHNDRIDNQAGHNKIDFLRQHGVKLFIDDYPYAWEDYIKAGISIATLRWPWTEEPGKEMEQRYPGQFIMHNNWVSMGSYLHLAFNMRRDDEKRVQAGVHG